MCATDWGGGKSSSPPFLASLMWEASCPWFVELEAEQEQSSAFSGFVGEMPFLWDSGRVNLSDGILGEMP